MSYQPYEPGGAAAAPAPAPGEDPLGSDGPWRVVIEYSNQGQAKPPTLVQIGRNVHAERHIALQAAKRAAFEFDPPDPWSPRGRQVFRDGPDAFLVVIEGATSTFHMSVRIVAEVTDA